MSFNKDVFPLNLKDGLKDEPLHFENGQYVKYITGNANFTMKFDKKSASSIPMEKNASFREPFDRLFITTEPTSEVIKIYVSENPQADATYPDANNDESSSQGETGQEAITDTEKEIFSSNPNTLSFEFRNTGSEDIFWSYTTGVTADTGKLLKPGEPFSKEKYTGGIFVICATGKTSKIDFERVF